VAADILVEPRGLDSALGPVLEPALARCAAELAGSGLGTDERRVVLDGLTVALTSGVQHLVGRLLVLELNVARVTGRLAAADASARWTEFLDLAGEPTFWHEYLPRHYPTLPTRLDRAVRSRCAGAVALAHHLAADRADLEHLAGTPIGEVTRLVMGAGDSHGGQTVSIVHGTGGTVVHKPRSLEVDVVLAALLARLPTTEIAVPAVLARDGYGWAAVARHRHCVDEAELVRFYRGIGHWLAVMRLLGGTDLHAENVVACGPVPVVVDCETLFTPYPPATAASGLGAATDRAVELVSAVLRTRLVPARRGHGSQEDGSGAGNLPDQQAAGQAPAIVDAGTDTARLGTRPSAPRRARNHPSAGPRLNRYWSHVVDGFAELTTQLVDLDRGGALEPLLDGFRGCRVRVVTRNTARYGELGWLLWHPSSLHDKGAAVRRVTELMTAEPDAPHTPDVVAAEIADLLDGDVPVFTTTPGTGRLDGPRGTTWGPRTDLVADALRHWRAGDRERERDVARASLVSAYLGAGCRPTTRRVPVPPELDGLDGRRRALAAALVRQLRDTAVRGDDGTASWVTPVRGPVGWYVHACGADLYSGAPGVAVVLAGYLHEARHGRADPVDGLSDLLDATLRTVRLREDATTRETVGACTGTAGRVWAWLTLAALAPRAAADGTARATTLAAGLASTYEPGGVPSDVFAGAAGAVVPLLGLAATTGEHRWTELVVTIGHHLGLPTDPSPGFAHGATGVGWALARLAAATSDDLLARRATFAFDHDTGVADPRAGDGAVAWCHGAVGIGLAAADLAERTGDGRHRETASRASAEAATAGFGHDHTLCHGDLGTWELLTAALRLGVAPSTLEPGTLDALVLGGIERHGPLVPHDVPAPGLFAGLGGIAYQLLRMHPDSPLPSALLLDT